MADSLEYLPKGERITAEHYHEVTRAARAMLGAGGGVGDADGFAVKPVKNLSKSIIVFSTYSAVQYSIGQLCSGQTTSGFTVYGVRKYAHSLAGEGGGVAGWGRVLVVFNFAAVTAGGRNHATIIPWDSPIKVKADPINYPTAGTICGPAEGDVLASKYGHGLICLADKQATTDLIEVVACGSPMRHRGRLESVLTTTGVARVILDTWNGTTWNNSPSFIDNVRMKIANSPSISAGKVVIIEYESGSWWVVNAEC